MKQFSKQTQKEQFFADYFVFLAQLQQYSDAHTRNNKCLTKLLQSDRNSLMTDTECGVTWKILKCSLPACYIPSGSHLIQCMTWLLHRGSTFSFIKTPNYLISSLTNLSASNEISMFFQGHFEQWHSSPPQF